MAGLRRSRQLADGEVGLVVRLTRVPGENQLFCSSVDGDATECLRIEGGSHRVFELDELHRERKLAVGGDVAAVAGDNEVLARCHERIEEQMSAFDPGVALAHAWSGAKQVVAIGPGRTQAGFVEAKDAHDAGRKVAHRDHAGDGDGAGAQGEAAARRRIDVGEQ